MSRADAKGLTAISVGISTMWLPIHYSFYRYSIVGEGAFYALALAVISANTVSTHSARLYRKMGVHARQELIDLVDGTVAPVNTTPETS